MSRYEKKATLPPDVKRLCEEVIRGNGARRKRYAESGLPFDRAAIMAVEQALAACCSDVADEPFRRELCRKLTDSLTYKIPYRYMGECCCGENKFYRYRREFCRLVAENLGLVARSAGTKPQR